MTSTHSSTLFTSLKNQDTTHLRRSRVFQKIERDLADKTKNVYFQLQGSYLKKIKIGIFGGKNEI